MSLFGEYFRAKKEPVQEKQTINNEEFYLSLNLNGTKVNDNQVMELPVVNSAINLITNILSQVNYNLFDIETNCKVEDERTVLINHYTNTNMSIMDFRRAIISDALIYGDSHIYVKKKGLKVESLIYVPRKQLVILDSQATINPIESYKDIKIQVGGKEYDSFEFINICFGKSSNGVRGTSLASTLGEALGTNKALNNYINDESSNGFINRGIVKSTNRIDKETAKKLKGAYSRLYDSNGQSLLILSNGLSYENISNTPNDIMLTDLMKISDEQICKAIGVPMAILEGNCTDGEFRIFLQSRIAPLISIIVSAFNDALLLFTERGKVEFRADNNALYQADLVSQVDALAKQIDSGIISKNEARKQLNMLPVDGLDGFSFSLGDIILDKGKYLNFNLGTVMDKDKMNNEENIVQE